MPNPLREAVDWVKADLPNLPADSTASASFPTAVVSGRVHVQVAWDGTPATADNREDAAIRVTVWANNLQPNLAIDEAEGLMVRLLATSTDAMQRVDRGSGRLSGEDPDTHLQFCTFTLQPVLTAPAP